jgi:signal transduction histidine kinase
MASTIAIVSVLAGSSPEVEPDWWRLLFVTLWLSTALAVAARGGAGLATWATVWFLVAFPVAFTIGGRQSTLLGHVWAALGTVSLVVFLYLFPRGQFDPRGTAVVCAASCVFLTARAFWPDVVPGPVDMVLFPLTALVPLVVLIRRYRHASNALDRRQMRLAGTGAVASIGGQLVLFGLLSAGLLGDPGDAESWVEPVSYTLALVIPLSLLGALVPPSDGVGRVVDRVLPSRPDDPGLLITRLGSVLTDPRADRDLLTLAASAIEQSMHLSSVRIDVRHASRQPHAWPSLPTNQLAWDVRHRSEVVGRLAVAPRPGARFSDSDRELLSRLAAQLDPLIRAVWLAEALQVAHADLLSAREEERRRLRDDLHDELGATLAGLILTTGLAITRVQDGDHRVAPLLQRVEATLQECVGQVREMVEGLRPLHLDELGLTAAIREQAARVVPPGATMTVTVHGTSPAGLPAGVELAAYRIAQEAITNAVRHSRGGHVDVHVDVLSGGGPLRVRVSDDGVGLGQASPTGHGLWSMRQRAREIGGRCTVTEPDAGGVVVDAELPWEPARVAARHV